MTCEALEIPVRHDEPGARVDPIVLRDHLAACPACRERWPEVWAVVAPRPERLPPVLALPRQVPWGPRLVAAAAALLLLAGIAGLRPFWETAAPDPEVGPPAPAPLVTQRVVPPSAWMLETRRVTVQRAAGATFMSISSRSAASSPRAGF